MRIVSSLNALSMAALMAVFLPLNASAQADTDVQSIQQDLTASQQILARARLKLDELLIKELPAVNGELQGNKTHSRNLSDQLKALRAGAGETEAASRRVSNQLQRSEKLLLAKQQELANTTAKVTELRRLVQQQNEGNDSPGAQLARQQAQVNALNEKIQIAQQLNNDALTQLDALNAELQRRDELSAQFVESESQHKQEIAALEHQLGNLERQAKANSRETGTQERRMAAEQSAWTKIEKSIAKRAEQRQTLQDSITSNRARIQELKLQRGGSSAKLEAAKAVTVKKKQQLTQLKAEVVEMKKSNRATEKLVRAEEKALADSEKQHQRELAEQRRLESEIEESIRVVAALNQNQRDMNAEIDALQKRTARKLATIEPLRKAVAKLRAQYDAQIRTQDDQQSKVDAVNLKLIEADSRFQDLASEKLFLEQELRRMSGS